MIKIALRTRQARAIKMPIRIALPWTPKTSIVAHNAASIIMRRMVGQIRVAGVTVRVRVRAKMA